MDLVVALRPDILEHLAEILARVSGLLLLAPVLSSRVVPKPSRMLLAVGLTAAMVPTALVPGGGAPSGGIVGRLVGEVALGVAMGLVAEFVFAAIDVASALLSFSTGMSYVRAVDPNTPVKGTALMTFQWVMATAMFLAVGGHQLLIRALATSFSVVPLGSVRPEALAGTIASASASILGFGLALAAPTLVVVMLLDLTIGLVGRVAPHIQALIIGMGLKPFAGLYALSLTYTVLPRSFTAALDRMSRQLGELMLAAAG